MTRFLFTFAAFLILNVSTVRAQSIADEAKAGIAASKEGDYSAAIEHFSQALASPDIGEPEHARLLLFRGFANQELGQYDMAIDDYTQAIALRPHFGQAFYRRGIAHREKGEFEAALADLDMALSLRAQSAPDWPFTLGDRGVIYFALGRYPEAIGDFTRLHEADPKDDYATLWLDLARAKAGLPADLPAQTDEWPAPLIALLRGKGPGDAAMKSAEEADDPIASKNRQCEADFVLGEWAVFKGDKAAARPHFEAVLSQCSPSLAVYAGASAELKRDGF